MKILHRVVLCFILSMIVGCSKNQESELNLETVENPNSETEEPQEPKTEVYFTLNTFVSPYPGEPSENWVILHDATGKLLDYRLYEAGDKLEFEAFKDTLTSTISVSYLNYIEPNGTKIYTIKTITNLELGHIENFGPYTVTENELPTKTGEFDILIKNIPNPSNEAWPIKVELSSGRGRLGSSGGGTGYNYGIELELRTVDKYESFDDYFISILDHNNDLRYYYFENALAENVSFDYGSDFMNLDSDISISLPDHISYYLNISGYKKTQAFNQYGGYWLHEVISQLNNDVPSKPLRMGYIDIFPKYRTVFSIQMEGYSYSNVHYGKPLDAISIPEKPSVDPTDTSINTFRFVTDIDYLSTNHFWKHVDDMNTRTSWNLIADKGINPTIGNLPVEILEKYPEMNIDLLEYSSTSFILPLREDAEFLSTHSLTVLNE